MVPFHVCACACHLVGRSSCSYHQAWAPVLLIVLFTSGLFTPWPWPPAPWILLWFGFFKSPLLNLYLWTCIISKSCLSQLFGTNQSSSVLVVFLVKIARIKILTEAWLGRPPPTRVPPAHLPALVIVTQGSPCTGSCSVLPWIVSWVDLFCAAVFLEHNSLVQTLKTSVPVPCLSMIMPHES